MASVVGEAGRVVREVVDAVSAIAGVGDESSMSISNGGGGGGGSSSPPPGNSNINCGLEGVEGSSLMGSGAKGS